jgi:glycosyltransferase involved in cell wall biosynthesis
VHRERFSRPISVLYVTDTPTVSGAENVLLSYLDRLPAGEYRTHVFLRGSNRRLLDELQRRRAAFTTTDSFSDRIIRTTWRPGDLWNFYRSFRAVRRELIALCAVQEVDILHSISYPTSLYTAFAARATGIPHVWHEHNVKRLHRFNRYIYRFAAGTCTYVLGPSNAVTRALAGAGMAPPKLRTVYNGINLDRFSPNAGRIGRVRRELGLSDDQPAVGLFGQMLPYKGHRTLIEAAPQILRQFPAARFFIVGALENPPYERELRSAIAAAGLESAFVFTGWRSDVQDVLGAMDVSVVATTTPEPAALSLMETMALSRPLIATRTGGTPEIVVDGETGLLFTPGRADELAERVGTLLRNPDVSRRMAGAGRRRMEELFSEERHIEEMKGLYRTCLSGRPADAASPAHAALQSS